MRIGFIGAGNMGGALIKGYSSTLSNTQTSSESDGIIVYDADSDKIKALALSPVVKGTDSISDLYDESDVIVICVKPQIIDIVLDELAQCSPDMGGKLIVSIAAGVSIGHMQSKLGDDAKIVRVMPNTPAMVGEGMSALSEGKAPLSESEHQALEKMFSSVGKTVWVAEDQMDIVTGISGSSPAYAYMYIEGLINAGIEGGLSRETATILAAQSTLGAAKMVLESGTDPVQLRINVCSPGGTTIEAVKVFEEEGFIETVEKAAKASATKSKSMSK